MNLRGLAICVKRSVSFLDDRFALAANGTNVRTEVLAGLTTFLTMAYIMFVQPAVLSAAGMDFGAVLTATCLATAIATLLMALLANYPIAVAPAMGHNSSSPTRSSSACRCRGGSRSAPWRSRARCSS